MKEKELLRWIEGADAVVIGAGAGLSTAAGLSYSGERFSRYFSDFIERYHMKDMYSAGFYPFAAQEEKWAYWSRHIFCNRYDQPAGGAYLDLFELVKKKNYFVLTTNVDHQFWLAGFEQDRIFATQGDYGKFQCRRACHDKLYDNEEQVRAMVREQKDCRIPSHLVPKCPVCGGEMEVNLRCDGYFVEDEAWHLAAGKYRSFLTENLHGKLLFLELGVGMNTPVIIKYPFWQMTYQNPNTRYACINLDENRAPGEIEERSVCIRGDIAEVLSTMRGEWRRETQERRRRHLIGEMKKEMPKYGALAVPKDAVGQKRLLRALMNVRPPMPVSKEFLEVQDAYLSEEIATRGIIDCHQFPVSAKNSRICLWQGDITRLKADAIVNAANSKLLGCFRPCHSCIDNMIHTYSGIQLRLRCYEIMEEQGHEEPPGQAKITKGYNLPCRYILHTVGPIICGQPEDSDRRLLADCYESCLNLAVENGIHSIAFCCISTGVFRFPQEEAAKIAVDTVVRFLEKNDSLERIVFDVFTDRDLEIYEELLS